MTSRYLPYASTPGRFFFQLSSDVFIAFWTFIWVSVGLAVHAAISTIADVGRDVQNGANGVAGNLDSAGDSASGVPIIGDDLRGPLEAAGEAAREIADAGSSLATTASWLAILLAIAVAAPPILALAMPWLTLRLRFWIRKWTIVTLAGTPAGEHLLALRALANRPLRKLVDVSADPAGAWRREDPVVVRGLAVLELRSSGIGAPRAWRE